MFSKCYEMEIIIESTGDVFIVLLAAMMHQENK